MEPLGQPILYFDTDSIISVSPTGEHLIHPDTTGVMGFGLQRPLLMTGS